MTRPKRAFAPEVACMIHVDGREYCIDPVAGIVGLLGKKWTLSLVGVLGNRPSSRFVELRDAIAGMGSKALAERLKELQRLGLVERTVYPEVPARVEYSLTASGVSLRRGLVPLLAWAAEQTATTRRK